MLLTGLDEGGAPGTTEGNRIELHRTGDFDDFAHCPEVAKRYPRRAALLVWND